MSEEHPLVTAYREFSPKSAEYSQRANGVFPGGDTRSSAHYRPYPLVMESGRGARLRDVDGHELIDFMNNFTSLIHGHAHPDVVAAVQKQVSVGTAYAAPNETQIELAELIASRVESIEQLRFTSSGTEGTQMAVRCARAATGRQKIMKMEGGYHGSYELAEVSLVPFPDQRGPIESPTSLSVDASFPDSVLGDTIVCPYNEPELARSLIDRHHDELAAIIVEPMLGSMGMVPAEREFLQLLRDQATRYGIVLVFDEVITLRLNEGGAQQDCGVAPDLTCMGKIIGGGLPVGGVGGKRELMQLFSPEQRNPVMHASTFSGNALTMAAGLASMQRFTQAEADRINALGERFRTGARAAFREAGIRGQATGAGSLSNIHFADDQLRDSRDAMTGMIAAGRTASLFHLGMIRRGVFSAARLMYCVSTPMDQSDIDFAVDAMRDCLQELRPHIERDRPQLVASSAPVVGTE